MRARLLELLTPAGDARLTAVTGPAGSGKTTLTSYWAQAGMAPGPVAWLTLDDQDNARGVFWFYILQAIQRCCPELDHDIPVPTQVDAVDQSTLTRLATVLATRTPPVTLILDHAEAVTNRAVAADIDFLLRSVAPGFRLIVAGRSARLVPLYRYQLAGDLLEIGADQLALTIDETAELLAAYGIRPSAEELDALYVGTEGWMTAVCLHALAAPAGSGSGGVPYAAGHQAVAEFLRTEILDAQPPRVQGMLLRTSILGDLHPDLADRLTGRYDARGALDQMVRANSFVQVMDDARFRYPRPFRDMLHDELTTRHPDLVRRLHVRAARWYAERGRYADSISHAVKAGAWDYAADVALGKLGIAWLLTSPDAEADRSTLVELPAQETAPAAQVLRPVIALTRFDVPAARAAADEAASTLQYLDGRADPLRLALHVTQVVLSRYTGDADAAVAGAAEADALWARLSLTEIAGEAGLRALVQSNLGVAALWAGRLPEARTALDRAAAATGPDTAYMVHDALAHLAMLALHEGRLDDAERHARESLAVADRAGLRAGARVGAASATLAATALMWNNLPAVREHLSRAMVTANARIDPPTAITIALVRARAASGRLDGRRALAAIDVARGKLACWRPSPVVTDSIELIAVPAHLLLGDTQSARRCLQSVSESAERALAAGQILAAEGDPEGARRLLVNLSMPDSRPGTRQDAALWIGKLAFAGGDTPAAIRALREALEYGRPERRRRPFAEAGTWVRQILRQQPELAAEHAWLSSPPETGDRGPGAVSDPLTDREVEVLERLVEALSTEDIAEAMYLSVNTVKTHLKSIYRKLGTSGRSAAARRWRELRPTPAVDGNSAP